jgi:hypothetical protein
MQSIHGTLKSNVILLPSRLSYLIFLCSFSPSSVADPDPWSCRYSVKITGTEQREGKSLGPTKAAARPGPWELRRADFAFKSPQYDVTPVLPALSHSKNPRGITCQARLPKDLRIFLCSLLW